MKNQRISGSATGLVLLFLVGVGACGGDPERLDPVPFEEEIDAGGEDDASEGGEDAAEEPGEPDDGEGDNCPEVANPDQRDRDRDGVGDACDHFPAYFDQDNPQSLVFADALGGPPNHELAEARLNWTVDLPFAVEGGILEIGEIDYFVIEVDEPKNLLVDLEGTSQAIWAAMIVIGDSPATQGVQTAILSDGNGARVVQDFFLPIAGRYALAVTDFRNVSEQPNVGGEGYRYRMMLSEAPLPEAEPLYLPTPRQVVTYEGEPVIFGVDVAGEDRLSVNVASSPHDQNSLLLPAIYLRDAETGRMLAYTITQQAHAETRRTELNLKLAGGVEGVEVLVEAHTKIGRNDLLIDIVTGEQPRDLETFERPRDSRVDHLLWMLAGSEIEAEIGPPKLVSPTSLSDDEDFFVLYAHPGQILEVSVEPTPASLLRPEVEFGEVWLYPDFEYFSYWHRGQGAFSPGDRASVMALITAERGGELVVLVRHGPNLYSPLPVGGPRYGYRLSVENHEVTPEAVTEFPAKIPVILGAGEQGIYEAPFEEGKIYDIRFNSGWSRALQIVDRDRWTVVESVTTQGSFEAEAGVRYYLAVRDSSGWAVSASDEVFIEIEEHAN